MSNGQTFFNVSASSASKAERLAAFAALLPTGTPYNFKPAYKVVADLLDELETAQAELRDERRWSHQFLTERDAAEAVLTEEQRTATDLIQGRRSYNGDGYSFGNMVPGDYGIGPDGDWWLMAPDGQRGKLDLTKHAVEEHAGGSITVSPSLVFLEESHVTPNDGCPQCIERAHDFGCLFGVGGWHGWLEHGFWRQA